MILALGDSASCFSCQNRPVKFRCRLTSRFTHSLSMGLGVGMTRGTHSLIRGLLRKRKSLVTCGLPIAGRFGSDMRFYKRSVVARRMLMRHGARGGGGTLGGIARLVKGRICMGPKGCLRHLVGLSGRLNNNVLVRRISGSDVAARSLVVRISGNRVSCTVYSGSLTGLGGACCPGLGVSLTIDFSRHTS